MNEESKLDGESVREESHTGGAQEKGKKRKSGERKRET